MKNEMKTLVDLAKQMQSIEENETMTQEKKYALIDGLARQVISITESVKEQNYLTMKAVA